MALSFTPVWLPMLLGMLLVALAGCDKVEEITDKAKQVGRDIPQSVEEPFQQLTEVFSPTGSMELQLTEPISTQACYATFIALPTQTGNVLQVASYKALELENFPSVFLRANVGRAGSLAELAGQTVQADLFVKTSSQEPTWHVVPGAPVELTISKIAEGQLTAEITGELTRNGNTETTPVTGTLSAVIE